ncbi:MAG: recombinase family protein [Bacilli bacterium]|nr:recombinase family protein [Bacilli bacterium]
MLNVIGYVRVSTTNQSTDLQIEQIKAFAKLKDYNLVNIYSDHATGKNTDRPGFVKMMHYLELNPFPVDAVMIYKLDRVGRSMQDLLRIVAWLKDHQIDLISITDNVDTTTSSGRFFFHITGAMAEYERELIVERTSAGLAKAKEDGIVLGRPRKNISIEKIQRDVAAGIPKTKIASNNKISTSTLYNILNAEKQKK